MERFFQSQNRMGEYALSVYCGLYFFFLKLRKEMQRIKGGNESRRDRGREHRTCNPVQTDERQNCSTTAQEVVADAQVGMDGFSIIFLLFYFIVCQQSMSPVRKALFFLNFWQKCTSSCGTEV